MSLKVRLKISTIQGWFSVAWDITLCPPKSCNSIIKMHSKLVCIGVSFNDLNTIANSRVILLDFLLQILTVLIEFRL
jgi:hypothetical protein